jgi:hypothetical protein
MLLSITIKIFQVKLIFLISDTDVCFIPFKNFLHDEEVLEMFDLNFVSPLQTKIKFNRELLV